MIKVICTTSNSYLHLIPVFIYLFNKNMPGFDVEIVGYNKPRCELPENFTFHSMGVQGDVSEWSTDLRQYFSSIEDEYWIWLMEDSFIRSFNDDYFTVACALMFPGIGRIDLTNDLSKRKHRKDQFGVLWSDPRERYRLSTQPSIWNKDFLLTYLTDGMTPWQYEVQDAFDDKWAVVGLEYPPVRSNEGVRKSDPHKLDLNGFSEEDVKHINKLLANG